MQLISTHAPHARRDRRKKLALGMSIHFYSRASCEARRFRSLTSRMTSKISTHAPHARRDDNEGRWKYIEEDFYSRASCEARLNLKFCEEILCNISTHAPHARRDFIRNAYIINSVRFLLTRLMRGATYNAYCLLISDKHFYSRASCEARL